LVGTNTCRAHQERAKPRGCVADLHEPSRAIDRKSADIETYIVFTKRIAWAEEVLLVCPLHHDGFSVGTSYAKRDAAGGWPNWNVKRPNIRLDASNGICG
jgi:hypothetical protein